MPMNTMRFSLPSSTLRPGFCLSLGILRQRIVDQVDFARHQRRHPRRVGNDRQVDHLVGVAFPEPCLDSPPVRILDQHRLDVGCAT
jgi:hypothetical protein